MEEVLNHKQDFHNRNQAIYYSERKCVDKHFCWSIRQKIPQLGIANRQDFSNKLR